MKKLLTISLFGLSILLGGCAVESVKLGSDSNSSYQYPTNSGYISPNYGYGNVPR